MSLLSDRFEKLSKRHAAAKPVYNGGATQRRVDVDVRHKTGRQIQFDAHRQGTANPKPAMRAAQSRAVAPRQPPQPQQRVQGRGRGRGFQAAGGRKPAGMPPRVSAQKTTGRGGAANGRGPGRVAGRGAGRTGGRGNVVAGARGVGRGGRGGRAAGRGGRGNDSDNKKKATKPVDLDEGLDEYWFKAGKGPDPKVASLDRGMDSYWDKAGEKTNGDAAAGDKMDDAEESEAAAVAPVSGVDPEL